jgi:murein DD-endopeptidase MepM/ murein hydrolase activator NlpD
MRRFQDYKKLSNKPRTHSPYVTGVLLAVLFFGLATISFAQTASDVQSKISQRNADIDQLEAEIRSYQSQLDALGQQKNSLSKSIKQLDLTRKKLNTDIAVTQKKIDKTNLTIEALSSQIENKEESIDGAIYAIELGIRETNEADQVTLVENILSENDFTEVWNNIDNVISIRDRMRDQIVYLRQVKGELEDTRTETIAAKKDLSDLKSELADQRKIVDQNTAEKNKLLAQTKNNESNYQSILSDTVAKKNALEQEVRNYESQLRYILDPSKLPSAGVFSWPLDKVFITQLFGKTESGKRLYVNGTHNGVDFRASVGTPVKAMADGVVAGTGDTDIQCKGASFGKFVFIKYDNGLSSAFGHLSLIKANSGQRVSRGEVVGYSGNTGYSTGPHLHVSVYAPNSASVQTLPSKACPGRILTQPIAAINAYLDPMYYLPPYKQ